MVFIPFLLLHEFLHLMVAMMFQPWNTVVQFDLFTHDNLMVTEVRIGEGYKPWQSFLISGAPIIINIGGLYYTVKFVILLLTLHWLYLLPCIYASVVTTLCGLSYQDIRSLNTIISHTLNKARNGNDKKGSKGSGPNNKARHTDKDGKDGHKRHSPLTPVH